MNPKATLYYVYDPMCSWCWGYRPTWQKLQDEINKQLKELVDIKYRVGGLAPDTESLMPEPMQQFLQQTWHKISSQLGTTFNFDFWRLCQPKRSTYPACRAVLVAREYNLEQEMYFAIQQAYYLNAKNPSEDDTLAELANNLGIQSSVFLTKLRSREYQQLLLDEISQARQLPINGFPSLVLAVNGRQYSVPIDYQNWQATLQKIKCEINAKTL